ncbi:hypothetical protein L6452_41531 [Arctium lappa]|uniref:Uncharacterized protein n=1 Tax=Arctium lappa TaxID=4217 RepID=A0ACB8XQA3_ARCLA|nr:hypothetical protein L6452_41531 [Arctium lappa]
MSSRCRTKTNHRRGPPPPSPPSPFKSKVKRFPWAKKGFGFCCLKPTNQGILRGEFELMIIAPPYAVAAPPSVVVVLTWRSDGRFLQEVNWFKKLDRVNTSCSLH